MSVEMETSKKKVAQTFRQVLAPQPKLRPHQPVVEHLDLVEGLKMMVCHRGWLLSQKISQMFSSPCNGAVSV